MKLLLRVLVPALLATLAPAGVACTAFLVCGNGEVLFGNNEDYWDPDTRIWFLPAEGDEHGRVYLGYSNKFPQGGMNAAGLAFDGFATGRYPMSEQDGKPAFSGNLIDHTMASCATVEEVIALLEGYDLRFLENAMLMFADKSGDSVIVEGDQFVRKEGDHQIVTNFYQSKTTPDRYTCPRYAAALRTLERGKAADLELCLEALDASKQTGRAKTLYSNVFDLKRGVMHLYLFHDFEHGVTLDLAEELAKGERTIDLPALFEETEAYDEYLAAREAQIAREAEQRAGEDPAPKVLDQYTGPYRFSVPGGEPVMCEIRREGARLVAETEGRDPVVLYPESSDRFFYVSFSATYELLFERGPDGGVEGLTLEVSGQTLRAERVRSQDDSP